MGNRLKIKAVFKNWSFYFFAGFALLTFQTTPSGIANVRSGFSPQKSTFSIQFNEEVSPYQISSMFLLPGETTVISLSTEIQSSAYVLTGATQGWQQKSASEWVVTAPRKPGIYPVRFTKENTTETMLVNVFVLVPYKSAKNGIINGYKIGSYPSIPASKASMYTMPKGFIEVTPENKSTMLSPHFRLGQFLCKQGGTYPKYIVLRERLPLKLEALMEGLNKNGVPCNSLSIMSGYRTPYYNRVLGNVRYSRHMFGDAADIFIDSEPGDNYMADLNGDGKRDIRDGEVLFKVMNQMDEESSFSHYAGGLAKYKPTSSHGPFVHVDARGAIKRWGN